MTVTAFLTGLANLAEAAGEHTRAATIRDYATIARQHEHEYLRNSPPRGFSLLARNEGDLEAARSRRRFPPRSDD